MSSKSTNLGLTLTSDADGSMRVMDWRLGLDGETNSNMTKIDEAIGELQKRPVEHWQSTEPEYGANDSWYEILA